MSPIEEEENGRTNTNNANTNANTNSNTKRSYRPADSVRALVSALVQGQEEDLSLSFTRRTSTDDDTMMKDDNINSNNDDDVDVDVDDLVIESLARTLLPAHNTIFHQFYVHMVETLEELPQKVPVAVDHVVLLVHQQELECQRQYKYSQQQHMMIKAIQLGYLGLKKERFSIVHLARDWNVVTHLPSSSNVNFRETSPMASLFPRDNYLCDDDDDDDDDDDRSDDHSGVHDNNNNNKLDMPTFICYVQDPDSVRQVARILRKRTRLIKNYKDVL